MNEVIKTCEYLEGNIFCKNNKLSNNSCIGLDCLEFQLKQEKQQNEELKAQLETITKLRNIYFHLSKGRTDVKDVLNQLETYKHVLSDIKEIAEKIIETDCYENSDSKAKQILAKIKEVTEC